MPFSDLPATARLWAYAADRPLTEAQAQVLKQRLDDFLDGWQSHSRPVEGMAEVRDRRFVLLAAHLPGTPGADVSGCGIDASAHVLESFAQQEGLRWQSGLHVFYRDAEGAVQSASRPGFEALAEQGTVHAATPVFDLSVQTVEALPRFEHPAGEGWHAEAFPLAPAPTVA